MPDALHEQLPPGPSFPRAAQMLRWVIRPTAFMESCRRRYGDTFTLRIESGTPWVLVSDPESIKRVFTGNPERLRAGEANVILRPVVGSESVLLLDGPSHMRQRKLLLPPFHGRRMQRYGELMREVAEREIEGWPAGRPFAVWRSMQAITLEVIIRAVFGVDDPARVERLAGRIRPMLEFTSGSKRDFFIAALVGPDRLAGARWTGFPQAIGRVHEAIDEEIGLRRADPGHEERDDILSMLLQARDEEGAPMTDQELRDELMTLLVAGHETTATSLAWTLERLVRHPRVLGRLEDEAESEDGEAFADAVAHEALRLRPVLPLVVRKLTEPLALEDCELPVGAIVAPCIYLVHRRPDVYPDPYAFRPERFLENPAGTYTWIPFGGGVRRCIGASFALFEMRTVLRTIVRHVHVEAADPEPERISRRAITLAPSRATRLVVHRRTAPARRRTEPAAAAAA